MMNYYSFVFNIFFFKEDIAACSLTRSYLEVALQSGSLQNKVNFRCIELVFEMIPFWRREAFLLGNMCSGNVRI